MGLIFQNYTQLSLCLMWGFITVCHSVWPCFLTKPMRKLTLVKLSTSLLLTCLLIYFLIVLSVYIPNMGGNGLNLPQNILAWIAIGVIVCILFSVAIVKKTIKWNEPFLLFAVGSILIILPFGWSDYPRNIFAIPRFMGLIGGLFFYLALLQVRQSPVCKRRLLFILVWSVVIQTVMAFWQASQTVPENAMEFVPGSRPYGIFQQVNVLASFVATGFCIALWFLFRGRTWRNRLLWLLLIAIFTVTLDLLQSRTGVAGVLLYSLFILTIRFKARQKGVFTVYCITVAAALAIIHMMKYFGVSLVFLELLGTVNKTGSTLERIAILKATLEMIRQHPLSGWGYGSFEYVLSRISLNDFHHFITPIVDHAHNEFLFEWAEGGILAVAGMFCMVAGFCMPLRHVTRAAVARWGLAIPIIVHMMLEYPLIQSVPHWIVLLLLCRLAAPEHMPSLHTGSRSMTGAVLATSLTGIIFLGVGVHTNVALTRFERNGMKNFSPCKALLNPWIQWDRWQYDEHTALLIRYNTERDPELLKRYARWGIYYLQRKNDLYVFQNLVRINKVFQDKLQDKWLSEQWKDYYSEASRKLTGDKRLVQ